MHELTTSMTGRWAIRTEDSIHILDLDAATHERRPLPRQDSSDGFDDHPTHYLLSEVIEWPRVGDQFALLCSLRSDPWQRRQLVRSAAITQISPAQSAVDELADVLPGRPAIRIPPGWCPLVMRLHHELLELESAYSVSTVKEKHGGLRFYIVLPDETPNEVADTMYGLIDRVEEEAKNRCVFCGAPRMTQDAYCGRHSTDDS
ncbi:hypothetical protein [Tsukamurella tyrosinosolvens]|uniref:hypothetical protein n=1 Tax=Tsukamurella tyrosinosolvens TaxID=57704 RepID=UPI000C7F5D43|nr:hypothetical protein [Tsukamurella tyrosinosolvens]AUN38690.1 hypothetical protein ASU32_00620 [Tsukamurella tyrosinosolvens]